jgi:phenylalanyl-tRNA synthetase alpha chain
MTNLFAKEFENLQTINACLEVRQNLNNSGAFLEIKEKLKIADKDTKKLLGQELNQLRIQLQEAADKRIQEIQLEQEKDNFMDFDPSFYSSKEAVNNTKLHPITQVTKEIVEIFQKMGFDVADGPLIAEQKDNFTGLNMPDYHPARAMQDTFFLQEKDAIGENYVLRTHTTSIDIPYAKSHKPPFRVIMPGKVFRNENIDATHDIMFHQIECLLIDRNVSLAQLKTLAQNFFSQFFNDSSLQIRLRPSYFPYTIPSMEVDMSNPFKNQKGNRLEGQEWIEAGGSGLLHPTVIRNMGLDPNEWGGLAFGFGIDRMAQIKLGVSGLGQFFEGRIDFLKGGRVN